MIDRSQTRSHPLVRLQVQFSRSSISSSTGSASTMFVPPFDSIPEMSDLQLSTSRLSRQPYLISSYHTTSRRYRDIKPRVCVPSGPPSNSAKSSWLTSKNDFD